MISWNFDILSSIFPFGMLTHPYENWGDSCLEIIHRRASRLRELCDWALSIPQLGQNSYSRPVYVLEGTTAVDTYLTMVVQGKTALITIRDSSENRLGDLSGSYSGEGRNRMCRNPRSTFIRYMLSTSPIEDGQMMAVTDPRVEKTVYMKYVRGREEVYGEYIGDVDDIKIRGIKLPPYAGPRTWGFGISDCGICGYVVHSNKLHELGDSRVNPELFLDGLSTHVDNIQMALTYLGHV